MLKYLNELFRTIPITIPIFTSIYYLIKRDNFILLFTIAFLSLSLVFTHILKFLFTYFEFIFDYFNNEKDTEIKIGFRFIFQSVDSTITETQVNDIINVIIEHTEEIDGITIPGLI